MKATAYYSPQRYNEREGVLRPENLDLSKLSRVVYDSFQIDEDGHVWESDSQLQILP